MFRRRHLGFSARDEPETSDPTRHSEQRSDPATSVSGESGFESAEENPCYRTRPEENPSTREETEWPVEENPYQEIETNLDPLASSTIIRGGLWTELRPLNSPIENLFSQILEFQNQPPQTNTNIMAAPVTNRTKGIALNKPDAYDGNRENFKKFLQDIEIYMDVNHEVYWNNLIKIAFVLSFMNSGPAATWKYQFVEEKNKLPPPVNPNDKLRQHANFRKDLIIAFSMFDSVGNALDTLSRLWMKIGSSINEHLAQFKLLAAATEINMNHALTIELFKETLTPALRNKLMNQEMPLNSIDDWYTWAMKHDHQWHKLKRAIKWMKGNIQQGRPQQRFYFPRKERDPNAMDVNRLTFDEQTRLMKEGRCFKCKNTGHRANDCPEGSQKKEKQKEELKKKMNSKEFYTHVLAIFKDLEEDDEEKFLEVAQEAGF